MSRLDEKLNTLGEGMAIEDFLGDFSDDIYEETAHLDFWNDEEGALRLIDIMGSRYMHIDDG